MVYNMMTCGGFTTSVLGGCSLAWFGFALVLFLALIARRQCDDGILAGTGFNLLGALGLGLGLNVLLTSLFGDARWSLLAGIAGIAIGGFGIGMFLGGGGEDNG